MDCVVPSTLFTFEKISSDIGTKVNSRIEGASILSESKYECTYKRYSRHMGEDNNLLNNKVICPICAMVDPSLKIYIVKRHQKFYA
jgi:hypothetical protein